jgi:hypothetical protein
MLLFALSAVLTTTTVAAGGKAELSFPEKVNEGDQITIKCDWSGFGPDSKESSDSCDLNCQRVNLIQVKITAKTEMIYRSSVNGAEAMNGWEVQTNAGADAAITKVAQLEDSNDYNCIVDDDAANFAMAAKSLLVRVIPSPPVIIAPSDKKLIINEAGEITCMSGIASPPPVYTWYKNDPATGQAIQLPADARTSEQFAQSSFTVDENKVKFLTVTEADEGEYFCIAKNEVGQTKGTPEKISVGSVSVASVVGIVFAVIFGVACLGVVGFIVYKKMSDDEYDEEHDAFDDDANDVQIGEAYAPYDHKSSRQDFSHVV